MRPVRDRSISELSSKEILLSFENPSKEGSALTVLRSTFFEELTTKEKVKQIAKETINKFPGITSAIIGAVVPLIAQKIFHETISTEIKFENTLFPIFVIPSLNLVSFTAGALTSKFIYSSITKKLFPLSSQAKTRAFRNWQMGNMIGQIGLALWQFNLIANGHLTACGMAMSSIFMAHLNSAMPSKEKANKCENDIAKQNRLTQMMTNLIKQAIDEELLSKEDVETCYSILAMQNIIVHCALKQLSKNDFNNVFSRLRTRIGFPEAIINDERLSKELKNRIELLSENDKQILNNQITKKEVRVKEIPENESEITDLYEQISTFAFLAEIEEIQSQLKSLSQDEMHRLEKKLALTHEEIEVEPIQSLFKKIANISFNLWYAYHKEIRTSIENLDKKPTFYKKFIKFLAE